MPPVPEASEFSLDPDWRPSALTDVYTVGGIKRIMAWFEEMRRYEAAAVAKSGSGLTRLDNQASETAGWWSRAGFGTREVAPTSPRRASWLGHAARAARRPRAVFLC